MLATQTLAMARLKVRRVEINGELGPGVYAKDVILHIIRTLGVNGGNGYAYEFGGTTIDAMNMEARMTVCNMAIEGGARVGYINPDATTYEYIKGRPFAPGPEHWDDAVAYWQSLASGPDASYDDVATFVAEDIRPTVTWGINPGQAVSINQAIPTPETLDDSQLSTHGEALEHMGPTLTDGGVNFAVYAENADRIDLLLFDDPESDLPNQELSLTVVRQPPAPASLSDR